MTPSDKERATIARLQEIISECRAEVDNLGADITGTTGKIESAAERLSPNIRLIEVPPACLDTAEGVAEFASTLPAMRVAFRVGAWPHLWALARCWAGYVLARGIVALRVPEAWRIVKVVR
jgi:hypothetical protein